MRHAFAQRSYQSWAAGPQAWSAVEGGLPEPLDEEESTQSHDRSELALSRASRNASPSSHGQMRLADDPALAGRAINVSKFLRTLRGMLKGAGIPQLPDDATTSTLVRAKGRISADG